jgi:hypothetical protein
MSKSNKKVSNVKPVVVDSSDSEDEQVVSKPKVVETKKVVSKSKKVTKEESDDESEDEQPVSKPKVVETKKTASKTKKVADESEDEQPTSKSKTVAKEDSDADSEHSDDDSDDDSDDESEAKGIISDASDEESEDKTAKNKKVKETFDSVKSRIKTRNLEIKTLYKTKSDQLKSLKTTEGQIKEKERLQRTDYDLLEKSHVSDLKRVRSERPKRKGNVNGGFNKEQPVPEVLRNFLNLPDDTALPRPKVVAALHNKFKDLKLKDKQMTKIDASTAKKLGLDGPVDIPFGKFQTWLAAFYPKDETKITVEVDV